MLYDRYGARNCMNVFSFLVMSGQGVLALGGYLINYNLLLLGRFIFGIGCENQIYTILVVEWFYHFELAMGMGMSEFLPLCASFSAGLVIPRVYGISDEPDQSFAYSFGIGFLITAFSYLTMLALQCLDYKMHKHDKKLLENFYESKGINVSEIPINKKKAEFFKLSDFRKFGQNYWLVCLSMMMSAQSTTNSLQFASGALQTRFGYDDV